MALAAGEAVESAVAGTAADAFVTGQGPAEGWA